VKRAVYAALPGMAQAKSVEMARSLMLLSLAQDGRVGHIPCALVRRYGVTKTDPTAHYKAVQTHLAAYKSGRVQVEPGIIPSGPLSVSWRAENPEAPIAVIIPTRNNGADLDRAISSLKAKAAAPDSLQIVVVDNGSSDAGTCAILDRLAKEGTKVIAIDEPFNWSRLNNQAVVQVDTSLLLFVNDDVTMLTDGWDQILRGLLDRREVGAVGARLLYPDETLQHAGMLFGWPGSTVIHDGLYESKNEPGPARRWHVTRAVSAVTGAFLATRREAFETHGVFDEINLPVAYSDVDYALKLRRSGLKILWTPQITLHHLESKTRGFDHIDGEKRVRDSVERAVMQRRWGVPLETEPALNPLWHMATRPFRLLAPPSQARLWGHIQRCAAKNPWAVVP
jgi:GT2 family glycosyltransferase